MSSGLADVHGGDLDGCELAGYTSGLAAGLGKALADLDDADLAATARGGYAAVPEERVLDGATVVEHDMATRQGIAILDVRLPAGLVPLRHAGDRPQVVGMRLAAVRIGLVRTLLDHALARPAEPPPRRRVALGTIVDVLAALGSLREQLSGMARHPSRADVVAVHTRLDHLDLRVVSLFGPDGVGLDSCGADHPARVLSVAALVADMWVGAGPGRR